MDYELARATAIRNSYVRLKDAALEDFDPHRKTVILLPGGMGSHLDRSTRPFDQMSPISNDYDPVWMDAGVFLNGDALCLEIDHQGRDVGNHIIIPNGALRFLVDAYDGTRRFFRDGRNGDYNYLVFGYDWRRPIEECAAYLHDFLRIFRTAVQTRYHRDPMPMTTLLCHSQGGLVAKFFIERVPNPLDWFEQVVTVATPFYGTVTHQARYYKGQAPLSQLHGAAMVAQIVSTLPGPYNLMPIDQDSFDEHHEAIGLGDSQYPMVDKDSGNPVDPYAPSSADRFPDWVNAGHREQARQIRRIIARPLMPGVARRFFNIRSAQDKKTATRQRWGVIESGFDPATDPSPVGTMETAGGGDGTVPFWSAWHASTPDSNRIDLPTAKDHGTLAENEQTLQIVKRIIDSNATAGAKKSKSRIYAQPVRPAKVDELETFIEDIRNGAVTRDDVRLFDRKLRLRLYRDMKR